MKNGNNESTKLVLSLLIGGIVGGGALYCIHAARNRKTPVLKKIGKTIVDVGEMLENCDLGRNTNIMESIEEKIPKGKEVVDHIVDWVDTGLTLWKKFKKG